ncbi:MAG: hypothetical protein A4E50_01793 [Methanosaeta sp. PtaB.Bin087]|nr:MAG: hypothetical protein A4E50_01793 [Methanosaeta sp. PtaB.Bin087]
MWTSLASGFLVLRASRIEKVPPTLLARNGSGPEMLRSTWVSAAKFTTASALLTSLAIRRRSEMSPSTKVYLSSSTPLRLSGLEPAFRASTLTIRASWCRPR